MELSWRRTSIASAALFATAILLSTNTVVSGKTLYHDNRLSNTHTKRVPYILKAYTCKRMVLTEALNGVLKLNLTMKTNAMIALKEHIKKNKTRRSPLRKHAYAICSDF